MSRRRPAKTRSRAVPRLVTVLATMAIVTGCPRTDGSGSSSNPEVEAPPRSDSGPGQRTIRVGNQARGVQDQPDYDRAALEIRERVEDRLPRPPPSADQACEAMLSAVAAQLVATEGADARAVKVLEATRAADHRACVRQTSPAAAACVRILVSEQEGEYPWLLDQCSRAFPAS